DDHTASESGSGNEIRQQTAQQRFEACNFEPVCERSVVLEVMGKRGLQLIRNEFLPKDIFPTEQTPAKAAVEAFLAQPATNGAANEVSIDAEGTPSALFITLTLHRQSQNGESAFSFKFTLAGDNIPEQSVPVGIGG